MTEGVSIPVATPNSPAPEAPAAAPAAPAAAAAPEAPNPAPNSPVAPAAPSGEPAAPEAPKAPEPKPNEPPVDPNAPKAPDATAAFKIPDEFKDKPWAAKVTSEAELWKALAGAQELIGRKSVVPDLKTATPEQREEFYKQLRPADASEYQFVGDMASPDIKTAVGKLFMDNGISAVQGNEIIKQYQALGEVEQAKMYDPEGFKQTMEQQFGKDWEITTGRAYNNLKSMMSDQDQKLMEHLPNAYAGLIYRTLGQTDKAVQAMMTRYGVKETNLAHFADKSGGAGATDINAVRAGLRAEMGRLVAGPHTADQIGALRSKLAATYTNDPRIQQGA